MDRIFHVYFLNNNIIALVFSLSIAHANVGEVEVKK